MVNPHALDVATASLVFAQGVVLVVEEVMGAEVDGLSLAPDQIGGSDFP